VKRLSSRATVFLKVVMPAFWLVLVVGVGVLMWLGPRPRMGALVMVCLLPVFLGLIYRFQVWPLADAVDDVGDALRIRRRGVEVRVPLADIVSVTERRNTRSRRVILRLRRAGALGDEIAFLPVARMRWYPSSRDPMVEDLLRRVDAVRATAAR
jgi:hypothetical protein